MQQHRQLPVPVADLQVLEGNPVLAERAFKAVKACTARGAQVESLGAAPLSSEPRIWTPPATHGPERAQWTITRVADDPLTNRGRIPIPSTQRRNLRRISKAGINLGDILIAHELPNQSFPNKPHGWSHLTVAELAWLHQHAQPPTNQRTVQLSDNIGRRIEHLTKNTGRVARHAINQLRRTTRHGAEFTPVTMGAAIAVLAMADPVIIGTVTASGQRQPGELAAYFVLARWEW